MFMLGNCSELLSFFMSLHKLLAPSHHPCLPQSHTPPMCPCLERRVEDGVRLTALKLRSEEATHLGHRRRQRPAVVGGSFAVSSEEFLRF